MRQAGLFPNYDNTLSEAMDERRRRLRATITTPWESALRAVLEDVRMQLAWDVAEEKHWNLPDDFATSTIASRSFAELLSPIAPLLELWQTGYAPGWIAQRFVLFVPPLS